VLTPALIQQWTDAIKQLNPGLAVKEFIPLSLNNGTMTIDNLTNFVPPEDLPLYKNREVGSSGDVGIAIRLNAAGADFFFEALGAGATSLGIMVRVDFKFNRLYPGGKFLIQADILKIYDFFSLDAKARASYFGLVGGEAEYKRTRETLTSNGAIHITIEENPNATNEEFNNIKNNLTDNIIKSALQAMVKETTPDTDAEAANVGDFFGGVSVSLKDREEVSNINLSGEVDFKGIVEEPTELSYNFGEFLKRGNQSLATDIVDDNKAPILIRFQANPAVAQYTGSFGYVTTSGAVVNNTIQGQPGATGALLSGFIQWTPTEQEPKSVDFDAAAEWVDGSPIVITKETLTTDRAGVVAAFNPELLRAEVSIVTDMQKAPEGTTTSINWRAFREDGGSPPINAQDDVVVVAKESEGQLIVRSFKFLYNPQTQPTGKISFFWSVQKLDGTTVEHSGTADLRPGQAVSVFRRAVGLV